MNWESLANSKGIHSDMKSEEGYWLNLGLTNRNRLLGFMYKMNLYNKTEFDKLSKYISGKNGRYLR